MLVHRAEDSLCFILGNALMLPLCRIALDARRGVLVHFYCFWYEWVPHPRGVFVFAASVG
jgi:hypothetical protein